MSEYDWKASDIQNHWTEVREKIYIEVNGFIYPPKQPPSLTIDVSNDYYRDIKAFEAKRTKILEKYKIAYDHYLEKLEKFKKIHGK